MCVSHTTQKTRASCSTRVRTHYMHMMRAHIYACSEHTGAKHCVPIRAVAGALQDFQGAIVAITHNPSFAASLNATHVLRVEGGKATLSTNMGLSAKGTCTAAYHYHAHRANVISRASWTTCEG